jgi:hypothetical protein
MSSRYPKPKSAAPNTADTAHSSDGRKATYRPADYPPGMLAIPALEWMWTQTVNSLLRIVAHLPPDSAMTISRGSTSPATGRNILTEAFLENPALQWICYLDSDMTPPDATILRLLSHKVDIVGAMCFGRAPPFPPSYGEFPGTHIWSDSGTIHEVPWIGTGCLLVQRKVIETLPYPWFEHPGPGVGEDVLFCHKVRALGMKVHVDCGMEVGHIGVMPVASREAFVHQKYPPRDYVPSKPSKRLTDALDRGYAAARGGDSR